MPLLVPDFIINPVLRQARRLSSNFTASQPESALAPSLVSDARTSCEDGISESEEDIMDPEPDNSLRRVSGSVSTPVETIGAARTRALSRRSRRTSEHGAFEQVDDEEAIRSTSAIAAGDSQPINIERSNINMPREILNSPPASFDSKMVLPEDDGMGTLRRRVIDIQSKKIIAGEKARLMHELLMEGYTQSQIARHASLRVRPETPSSPTISGQSVVPGPLDSLKFWQSPTGEPSGTRRVILTEDDLRPTFAPLREIDVGFDSPADEDLQEPRFLGCEHYRRNVKMQCFTCQRWYTCRLCHDDAEDHILPRKQTENMLCMFCGHAQKPGDICVKCGESAARYYCNICKLWNDDPGKSIYHCNDCGICRVGEGLGKDFIHCKKCGSCIAITMEESHKCREGAMDSDCPICGENLFTSYKKVLWMKCGHMIHEDCRMEYIKNSYKCPICGKSVENMESQFRRLDRFLEEQPMPAEYQNTRAVILCNDCGAKTSTKFHWGGLKCEVCLSYNTAELQVLNSPHMPIAAPTNSDADWEPFNTIAVNTNITPQVSGARVIPPSRPTAHRLGTSGSHQDLRNKSPTLVPARFARSVSPEPVHAFAELCIVKDDSDQEEDMFDFWGREERRSTTSPENGGDGASEREEDDESDSDVCGDVDEEEDDEEEEIALFGHR